MFGKWIVLEGSSPLKSQITNAILKSYPGAMRHIMIPDASDMKTNLWNILKLKEQIMHHLFKNESVICSSWIASIKMPLRNGTVEMELLDEILKSSRPDLSVALLASDSERNLLLSGHIDLALNVKNQDENKISRVVLDHLLHNDF